MYVVVVIIVILASSVLIPNPKKILDMVASPTRGLLNREKRIQEKGWQLTSPPSPPSPAARSEKIKYKSRDASTTQGATQVSVRLAPLQDSFDSSARPMGVASHNSTLPCAITTFPVSIPLAFPGDI